jgi:hypothetical protein
VARDAALPGVPTVAGMRVLTLNIWARCGPYGLARAAAARASSSGSPPTSPRSRRSTPAASGGADQATELLGPLGYEVEYEPRSGDYRGDPGMPSRRGSRSWPAS